MQAFAEKTSRVLMKASMSSGWLLRSQKIRELSFGNDGSLNVLTSKLAGKLAVRMKESATWWATYISQQLVSGESLSEAAAPDEA